MRGKETGQAVAGTTAMNDDRVHELEEMGFIWALRGGEGKGDINNEMMEGSEEMGSEEMPLGTPLEEGSVTNVFNVEEGAATSLERTVNESVEEAVAAAAAATVEAVTGPISAI
jgi:hypothetical protein